MTAPIPLILRNARGHRSCEKIGIKRYSPPCITARRGGCVINKITRSHRSRRSRGGFPFVLNRKTTPASRSRRLRDTSRHFIDRSATPPCVFRLRAIALALRRGDARRGICVLETLGHFFHSSIERPYSC